MPIPTETALRTRARTLLEAMHERGRWIYAVPCETAQEHCRSLLEAEGLLLAPAEAREASHGGHEGEGGSQEESSPLHFQATRGETRVLVREEPELEVTLIDAAGPDAPALLAALLEKTGFFAQSTLLGTAHDLDSPEASAALATLASMVVRWDGRWADLFAAHLASTDEAQRLAAAHALRTARAVAGSSKELGAFLDEARANAKSPALGEALQALEL
jgi:hypothetical protein